MIWPFKKRDVGPCIDCAWHILSKLEEHRCANPAVILDLRPVEGGYALCERARERSYGVCKDGVLFRRVLP
jgi:hypothetical protein